MKFHNSFGLEIETTSAEEKRNRLSNKNKNQTQKKPPIWEAKSTSAPFCCQTKFSFEKPAVALKIFKLPARDLCYSRNQIFHGWSKKIPHFASTLYMISPTNFHFQRLEFELFQLWLIVLTLLVCFGYSSQCPLTISECNAMSALQTSFNLSATITNNSANPCSKK